MTFPNKGQHLGYQHGICSDLTLVHYFVLYSHDKALSNSGIATSSLSGLPFRWTEQMGGVLLLDLCTIGKVSKVKVLFNVLRESWCDRQQHSMYSSWSPQPLSGPYIKGLLDPCTNSMAAPNIPAEVLYDKQASFPPNLSSPILLFWFSKLWAVIPRPHQAVRGSNQGIGT